MQRLMANSMTLDNLLSALDVSTMSSCLTSRARIGRSSKEEADLGSFASMGIEFKSGTQIFHAADGDDDDEEEEEDDGEM